MNRGPARDASHDDPSTEAPPERGAATTRTVPAAPGFDGLRPAPLRSASEAATRFTRRLHASKSVTDRMPSIVRSLHLLLLAIISIVCAGSTCPGPASASPLAAIHVVAPDGAIAARLASAAPQPSHQWRRSAAHATVDRDPIEIDDNDDRDTRGELAADSPVAFEDVWLPGELGRAPRREPRDGTPRFAVTTGSPRGPPST